MPRRDGTGPMGAGSMTGRGLGPCADPELLVKAAVLGLGLGIGLTCRHRYGNRIRSNRRSFSRRGGII
jgi:hypothetical protein